MSTGSTVCLLAPWGCSPHETQSWQNHPANNQSSLLTEHHLWAGLGSLQTRAAMLFLLKTPLDDVVQEGCSWLPAIQGLLSSPPSGNTSTALK